MKPNHIDILYIDLVPINLSHILSLLKCYPAKLKYLNLGILKYLPSNYMNLINYINTLRSLEIFIITTTNCFLNGRRPIELSDFCNI